MKISVHYETPFQGPFTFEVNYTGGNFICSSLPVFVSRAPSSESLAWGAWSFCTS